MEIKKKEISGVYEIVCKPIGDERGFFMRSYDDKIFGEAGISHQWVQENHSKTEKKGTIRGLHLQLPPFAETKLIRVGIIDYIQYFSLEKSLESRIKRHLLNSGNAPTILRAPQYQLRF